MIGAASSTLVASLLTVVNSAPAAAHGAMMFPGSRTYLCYKDAVTPSGAIQPTNPACAAAIAQSGTNSIWNWFAVLRSDGAGRTRGFIPDGRLCSGAATVYDFEGYNLARDDWPVTHLTAGATIQFRYNKWAHHPGPFHLYITKDGWDPTRPLTWDDLEPTPFYSTEDNPPSVGSPGSEDAYYYWNAKLPNKTGRHIIYSVWARTDSPETFYNCSDVVFDGGNGEVTGIRGTLPNPPNTSPSPGVPNTSPSPGVPNTSPSPSPSSGNGSGPGNGACTATYRQVGSWSGGFQGEVTVQNSTSSSLNSWTVKMSFPGNLTLNSLWNGVHTTSGSEVTVKNAAWNGSIGPNASTTFGFVASGSASTPSLTCSSP